MMNQKRPVDLQRIGIYLIGVAAVLFLGGIPACYLIFYILPHTPATEILGFVVYLIAVLPVVPALFATAGAILAVLPVAKAELMYKGQPTKLRTAGIALIWISVLLFSGFPVCYLLMQALP